MKNEQTYPDRCVCCGEPVPEGYGWVCPACKRKDNAEEAIKMTKQSDEYKCEDCVNAGTPICMVCVAVIKPSRKDDIKPSMFCRKCEGSFMIRDLIRHNKEVEALSSKK